MDIFTSIVQTSKKLDIRAYQYLRDRLSRHLEMPCLSTCTKTPPKISTLVVERIPCSVRAIWLREIHGESSASYIWTVTAAFLREAVADSRCDA